MKMGYVMFEEWLAERYPVLDEIAKSRRTRYAITPELADEIKEYCKEAFAAGAASTPEAAGRVEERGAEVMLTDSGDYSVYVYQGTGIAHCDDLRIANWIRDCWNRSAPLSGEQAFNKERLDG